MYWAVVLWGWFSAEQVSRSVLEHGLGLTGPVVTSITLGWLVWRTARRPGLFHRSR